MRNQFWPTRRRLSVAGAAISLAFAGVAGAQQLLRAGVNDLGGTLMDENISRAAGAAHGQGITVEELRNVVEPIGRTLVERTTLYGSGRPLVARA